MGNVRSIKNAFNLLGEEVVITSKPDIISKAEAIVVPGVGAFSEGMENLLKRNLIKILEEEVIKKKKPYLGICLGLEFLAEKSFEGGEHAGLGWIKGEVTKIKARGSKAIRVPHIGWNDTIILKKEGLYSEMENLVFYYLHSYFLKIHDDEKSGITATCEYGGNQIIASFQKNNIYAVQFHPEKSQSAGIKLLKNFLEDIRKNAQT